MGLRDVGQIATIRVHPTNPDIVYVAAQGNPFVAEPGTRRISHHRRRQDLEAASSTFPTPPAPPIWNCSPAIPK